MITDNYIKKCEQAEEIQKAWRRFFKNYLGDLFWKGKKYLMIPEACSYVTEVMFEPRDEHIWLPTLEQLFEIAHKAYNKNAKYKAKEYEIIADFIDWILNSDIDKYKDFNLDFNDTKSCLLIYIMEEFYNKIWTGEKWEMTNE